MTFVLTQMALSSSNCDAENIASRVPVPVHLILSHRSFVYPRSGQAPFAAAPLRAVTAPERVPRIPRPERS